MPAITSAQLPGADPFASLPGSSLQKRREIMLHGKNGDANNWSLPPVSSRVVFLVLSVLPLTLTLYLFYRRCRRLTLKSLRGITYIRFLVIQSYVLAIAFNITSICLITTKIDSLAHCRNSIYVCIGFLFAGKISLQLFLIERAHVANINYLRRRDDPVWWASMGALTVGGSALAIWTYINPVYYMDRQSGRCHKGLPPNVVAPIQAFEMALNILLTIVFVRMLRRTRMCELFAKNPERESPLTVIAQSANWVARKVKRLLTSFKKSASEDHAMGDIASAASAAAIAPTTSFASSAKLVKGGDLFDVGEIAVLPASIRPSRLRNLAWKSLIGTLFCLGWTILNSVIFYSTGGREKAWLCFIQCNLDVTLSVWVLHWLTADPKDDTRTSGWTRSSVAELPTFSSARAESLATSPSGSFQNDRGDSIIQVPSGPPLKVIEEEAHEV